MEVLTEPDIRFILETRDRELAEMGITTFEERRRYLAKVDMRVTIKDGEALFSWKSRFKLREGKVSEGRAYRSCRVHGNN